MENNALKINENDNVAIAMHDLGKGDRIVIDGQSLVETVEGIEAGHKVALASIASGGRRSI